MKPVLPMICIAGVGAVLLLAFGVGAPAFAQEGQDPPDGEEQPERIPAIGKPPARAIPGMPGSNGQGAPGQNPMGGQPGEGGEGGEGQQGGGVPGGPGGMQGGPGGMQGGPGGMQGGPGGMQGGPKGPPGGLEGVGNGPPAGGGPAGGGAAATVIQHAPCVQGKAKITMDYVDAPVGDVVKYMAEITCKNFIIKDDLSGKITIISHQQVTIDEAYEAFLSALEVNGYTTVQVGKNTKVVPTSEAANTPLRVYQSDDPLPATDGFVTQIIQLENVSVADMGSVVKELAGSKVRVVTYLPTNTLIVTDAAYNIRRVSRIIAQLDVAAPKSKLAVIPLKHATAADVEKVLEEVYAVAASSTSSSSGGADKPGRKKGKGAEAAGATGGSSTNVGAEGVYISKIISDERTNSLILLANEEALADVKSLIATLDADIDPSSRSQIHVIYLENAKATDVASVLQDLSSSSSSTSSRSTGSSSSNRKSTSGNNSQRSGSSGSSGRSGSSGSNSSGFGGGSSGGRSSGGGMPGGAPGDGPQGPPGGLGGMGGSGGGSGGGAVAAFDSGMRVTADENTNSLVIIAAPEDYRVIQSVISKLDIRRRQVFVEAVVLEIGSEDELDLGIGYHGGLPDADGNTQFFSSQLNGSSLGVTADALSGLAMGIFGAETVELPTSTGVLTVPLFGIALNALASNSGVDILSNPSLLIVDNEDAKISVGRNVPFPVSSGRDNNNNPIVSYQREDVGIELTVTPQINESNTVTMELTLKVAEVEEDNSGLDVSTAGFITSERETENVVVVDDNQTIVIGGLIGRTSTKVETKIPILGDIPLIGALFRGKRNTERKTNLLIFLTPHVINDAKDLEEVYRVKWAQRQEFIRRFYGKSRDEQQREMGTILAGSMTAIDQPSQYRTKDAPHASSETIGVDSGAGSILPATGTTPDSVPPAPTPTPEPAPAEPAPSGPAPSGGN